MYDEGLAFPCHQRECNISNSKKLTILVHSGACSGQSKYYGAVTSVVCIKETRKRHINLNTYMFSSIIQGPQVATKQFLIAQQWSLAPQVDRGVMHEVPDQAANEAVRAFVGL